LTLRVTAYELLAKSLRLIARHPAFVATFR